MKTDMMVDRHLASGVSLYLNQRPTQEQANPEIGSSTRKQAMGQQDEDHQQPSVDLGRSTGGGQGDSATCRSEEEC